jgi:hypothetical protein
MLEGHGKLLGEPRIHQVEAASELDQRADDCRGLDLAPCLLVVREPQRPVGTILPEIDPLAEPVIVVLALLEGLAAQQTLRRLGIAPVVRDHCTVVVHREDSSDGTTRV